MDFTYRSFVDVGELAVGECTGHRAQNEDGSKRWWLLWFLVTLADGKTTETMAVPVLPRDTYTENGPGGRTWGLNRAGPSVWLVTPSVNVLDDPPPATAPPAPVVATAPTEPPPGAPAPPPGPAKRVLFPGPHPRANDPKAPQKSVWHDFVRLTGVPDADSWTTGAAP